MIFFFLRLLSGTIIGFMKVPTLIKQEIGNIQLGEPNLFLRECQNILFSEPYIPLKFTRRSGAIRESTLIFILCFKGAGEEGKLVRRERSLAVRQVEDTNKVHMYIHFLCLCPLCLTIKLNFNVSKVVYCMSFSPVRSAAIGCSEALRLHSHGSADSPLWAWNDKVRVSLSLYLALVFVICLLTSMISERKYELVLGKKLFNCARKAVFPLLMCTFDRFLKLVLGLCRLPPPCRIRFSRLPFHLFLMDYSG